MYKLLVYIISLMLSSFAISGIQMNSIFKPNHVNEAKCFMVIVTLSLTYLLANFIIGISSINLISVS